MQFHVSTQIAKVSWKSMMWVHILSKKGLKWEVQMMDPGKDSNQSSNHLMLSTSKWPVGSSNINTSAFISWAAPQNSKTTVCIFMGPVTSEDTTPFIWGQLRLTQPCYTAASSSSNLRSRKSLAIPGWPLGLDLLGNQSQWISSNPSPHEYNGSWKMENAMSCVWGFPVFWGRRYSGNVIICAYIQSGQL